MALSCEGGGGGGGDHTQHARTPCVVSCRRSCFGLLHTVTHRRERYVWTVTSSFFLSREREIVSWSPFTKLLVGFFFSFFPFRPSRQDQQDVRMMACDVCDEEVWRHKKSETTVKVGVAMRRNGSKWGNNNNNNNNSSNTKSSSEFGYGVAVAVAAALVSSSSSPDPKQSGWRCCCRNKRQEQRAGWAMMPSHSRTRLGCQLFILDHFVWQLVKVIYFRKTRQKDKLMSYT